MRIQTLAGLLRHCTQVLLVKKQKDNTQTSTSSTSAMDSLLESLLSTAFSRFVDANDLSLSLLADTNDVVTVQKAVADVLIALPDEVCVLSTKVR